MGHAHAGKTVTVTVEAAVFQATVDLDLTVVIARTGSDEVHRYKVNAIKRTPRVHDTSTEANALRFE